MSCAGAGVSLRLIGRAGACHPAAARKRECLPPVPAMV